MIQQSVLIVEDEELMRSILRRLLHDAGYEVFTADSSETALETLARNEVSVTLTDVKMAGMDGLQLLDRIKAVDAEALVIIMTAYSSVDTAVAALRKGAYDYVTKPFVNEDLLQTIKNAIFQRELFRENRALRRALNKQYSFADIIGQSEGLKRVFGIVEKVATTSSNVLIQGESGTGKELIAKAIHFNGGRSVKPFLAVNCGALPENLLESELFGHARGSFTGATSSKKGLFRSADGGTVFLDEVGEMSPTLQVKLLRALQEHEVTPLGTSMAVRFNARIIAATNRDLESEVAADRFREDLFYRLNVIEIEIPPLRERRDDIPLLVRHFAAKSARNQNSVEKPVTPEAMAVLIAYAWPGNVRELENVIERAFVLSDDEIDVASLPQKLRNSAADFGAQGRDNSRPTLEEVERSYVMETMQAVDNDKAAAARILGIDLSTLYRKLKRYEEL